MWPLPPIRDEVIAIVIEPAQLYCGLLNLNAKNELCLSAFACYPLESATHITLYHQLQQFIKDHQLAHSFVTIVLSPPLVYQELVSLSTASPNPADFNIKQMHQMIWDYHYLHARDDGMHLFYLKGIQKPRHFEYQLLAQKSDLKLTALTSIYGAQLAAYTQWQGKAFRSSKLALDLAKHQYDISQCMDRDALARLIKISPKIESTQQTLASMAAMIGSYYCQQRRIP